MKGLHNLKEDFLYRALRTDEDPYRNIECKDRRSNRTVDEHVKDGLTFPSMYISTTASFDLAQKWINTSQHFCSQYKRSTTIVKIDVNHLKSRYGSTIQSAYNFTEEAVRDSFLTGNSRKYARRYEEVVFERLIPVSAISDIHVEGRGWIGTSPPRSEPTPISIPTLPSIRAPSIFTSYFTSITPPSTSIRPLVSPSISPTLNTTSCLPTIEPNSSQDTTMSSSISFSPPFYNQSDISISSASGLDMSADTIYTITPVKRSTGVKRSCEVDSEVKPAKYVCVDKESIQSAEIETKSDGVTSSTPEVTVSDNQIESDDATPSTSKVAVSDNQIKSEDTSSEEVTLLSNKEE